MATLKQKRAIERITENPSLPISRVMLEVGYDPDTASKPSNLTESKAWKEIADKFLPDELLAKIHLEGLQATKIHGSMTEPDQVVPDYPTRKGYLELGYKVKGKMADDKPTTSTIGNMTVIFQRKENNED